VTSRHFRGAQKRLHMTKREWNGEDIHPYELTDTYQGGQDRFRGFHGRRNENWGWEHFGDGLHRYVGLRRPRPRWNHPWEDPTNYLWWSPTFSTARTSVGG